MEIKFKYHDREYLISANNYCYMLCVIQKNEEGEEYEARKKYFNKLSSIFDVILRDTLSKSTATTIKELLKEIREFKKWAKKNFTIIQEKLD